MENMTWMQAASKMRQLAKENKLFYNNVGKGIDVDLNGKNFYITKPKTYHMNLAGGVCHKEEGRWVDTWCRHEHALQLFINELNTLNTK